ncbi:hypothetical protein BPAE_0143g00250 [Botrytis paeoniae]|uniref:2EXR domain-containing protein n=1 Tax=Botrytis paeoniae TaxID=278948 RepID=A0A4Z1FN81_9HELO|nr:hypothetical protein BPAE_0143g00250 [Botrytis paeoniae]
MAILNQFTVFPKLSDDLKAMIWDLVSQQPSRIQFGSYTVRKTKNFKRKNNEPASERDKIFSGKYPDYPWTFRLSVEVRVPSVLITCRESRYWAMKHYRFDFKDQLYSKALWFNHKVDILTFDTLDTLLVFAQGGCARNGPISLIRDSSKMPVVERIVLLGSLPTYAFRIAMETTKNFPHLNSLVLRTDDLHYSHRSYQNYNLMSGTNIILPSIRVQLEQLWNSDEWETIRAYGQVPELRFLTAEEMWNTGLAKPLALQEYSSVNSKIPSQIQAKFVTRLQTIFSFEGFFFL